MELLGLKGFSNIPEALDPGRAGNGGELAFDSISATSAANIPVRNLACVSKKNIEQNEGKIPLISSDLLPPRSLRISEVNASLFFSKKPSVL